MSEHHDGTPVGELEHFCALNQLSLFEPPAFARQAAIAVEAEQAMDVAQGIGTPSKLTDQPKRKSRNIKRSDIHEKYKTQMSYGWMINQCKGKPNEARNCAFARGFMNHLGKNSTDDVVNDLMADDLVDGYLDAVGRNANRTSALSYLRLIINDPARRSFEEAVSRVIVLWTERDGSISSLARHVELSVSTLWGYANGTGKPSKRKVEALRKLEMVGELKPGSLTQHVIKWQSSGFVIAEPFFDLKNPFYSYEQIGTPTLPLPPRLIEQVQMYFEFKTCPDANASVELRNGSGRELFRTTVWTKSIMPAKMAQPFAGWNDFSSATGNLAAIAKLCSFVDPGRGTSADSLAVAFDVKTVEQVLRRDMKLAGGFNHGHENFVAIVAHLLHPSHGFLVQFPDLFLAEANRLGLDTEGVPWNEFVAMRHAEVCGLPQKLVPEKSTGSRARRSRDKKRKLKELLSLSDAYSQVVYPTLKRLYAERPPSYAPEVVKLDFEIKYLTLTLFAACPLRLLNWAYAEWGSNLRKRQGQWWVEIPLTELKNRRIVKEDYSFMLPNWASEIVERFFRDVKPRMAAFNPDAERLVLAGPQKGRARAKDANGGGYERKKAGSRVYRSIKHRMSRLTKQLWNLAVTPHDWRDIYGTDYLNKYPGEVLTVAAALNDTVRTVLKKYADPSTARLSRHAAKNLDAEWAVVA